MNKSSYRNACRFVDYNDVVVHVHDRDGLVGHRYFMSATHKDPSSKRSRLDGDGFSRKREAEVGYRPVGYITGVKTKRRENARIIF